MPLADPPKYTMMVSSGERLRRQTCGVIRKHLESRQFGSCFHSDNGLCCIPNRKFL